MIMVVLNVASLVQVRSGIMKLFLFGHPVLSMLTVVIQQTGCLDVESIHLDQVGLSTIEPLELYQQLLVNVLTATEPLVMPFVVKSGKIKNIH